MKMLNKICLAITAIIISSLNPVAANDELYLCGTVREVNRTSSSIVVDVATLSCQGTWKFNILNELNLTTERIGEKLCFFIDSDICKSGYVYTITHIDEE